MDFQAQIRFKDDGVTYLTMETQHKEHAYDMVLEIIYNSLALLSMANHSFYDDVIDNIKMRVEELRSKWGVCLKNISLSIFTTKKWASSYAAMSYAKTAT